MVWFPALLCFTSLIPVSLSGKVSDKLNIFILETIKAWWNQRLNHFSSYSNLLGSILNSPVAKDGSLYSFLIEHL